MVGSCYVIDYGGRFAFPAAPEVIWSALQEPPQFERWWAWLGDLTVEGDALAAGSVMSGTVTPPLPYRMRIRVAVERSVPPTAIDATVSGDLRGEAHLRVAGRDGGSVVDVAWTIEMLQRPMRLAARVAHPVLRWGHDRVVDATVRGFLRQVAADLASG